MDCNSLRKLAAHVKPFTTCSCVVIFFFVAACREAEQRPQVERVPIAKLEETYGRLFAAANEPTLDQHGTGDRLGLFRDASGTVWGIPLTIDENGNVLGCAPPALRDAPASDALPDNSFEIIGAANEPTGWREGTGKLGLLLRDAQGKISWQSVAALEIKTGPVCLSQSSRPQPPLAYYRLAKRATSK